MSTKVLGRRGAMASETAIAGASVNGAAVGSEAASEQLSAVAKILARGILRQGQMDLATGRSL